ncbi:MAG: class B sortase [Clostridia bacterium]|nr:class B sortase [Clostridia bacterium]
MEQKNTFKKQKSNKILLWKTIFLAVLVASAFIGMLLWSIRTSDNYEIVSTVATTQVTTTSSYPQFTSERLKEKYEYNNDVVGWITITGTDIDDEVLQSTDNDYYLRKTIDETSDIWGCYFVDYKCNVATRDDLSKVTIIYGHSLKDYSDGKKFTQLKRYNDIDFCNENSIITFSLLYDELRFKIFSISLMPINFDYIQSNPTDERFSEVLAKLYETNVHFFPNVSVEKDDHILLLQTCTSNKKYRFIVAAKLIEE